MNSKRQVKGKLGRVVQINLSISYNSLKIKFMCVVPTSMYEKPDRSQVAMSEKKKCGHNYYNFCNLGKGSGIILYFKPKFLCLFPQPGNMVSP